MAKRAAAVAAIVAAAQTVVPAAAARGHTVSASPPSSSSLPKTCAADSFISAQLNWPVAVVRAWMPPPLRFCSLQAPSRLSRVASAIGIAASVTCGPSKRDGLAVGCSVAGSARVKGVGVEGQSRT